MPVNDARPLRGQATLRQSTATATRSNCRLERIALSQAYRSLAACRRDEMHACDRRPTDAINYRALSTRQCAGLSVYHQQQQQQQRRRLNGALSLNVTQTRAWPARRILHSSHCK